VHEPVKYSFMTQGKIPLYLVLKLGITAGLVINQLLMRRRKPVDGISIFCPLPDASPYHATFDLRRIF
jgi:hypothetical protein